MEIPALLEEFVESVKSSGDFISRENHNRLGEVLIPNIEAIASSDDLTRRLFEVALTTNDVFCVSKLLERRTQIQFEVTFTSMYPPLSLGFQGGDISRLSFNSTLHPSLMTVFTTRFMWMFSFLKKAVEKGVPFTVINLGDSEQEAEWSFCSNKEGAKLIPDCYFIGSHAYHEMRCYYEKNQRHWSERKDLAFWRGSSTGIINDTIENLPRVQLSLLARNCSNRGKFDVGIVELVQVTPEQRQTLQGLDIFSTYSPWQDLINYKYHVDIDGNTNSWPGLFMKLLSGGLIFKIASQSGYKQWYYDRLVSRGCLIWIKADMSDLVDRLDYFRSHQEEASRIAAAGYELAQEMSFEKETSLAIELISREQKSSPFCK